MKRKTYLDFIQELLADDEEFCAFKNTYQQRIQKSIKPIISRIEKSDFFSFLEKQSWNFSAPNLSF